MKPISVAADSILTTYSLAHTAASKVADAMAFERYYQKKGRELCGSTCSDWLALRLCLRDPGGGPPNKNAPLRKSHSRQTGGFGWKQPRGAFNNVPGLIATGLKPAELRLPLSNSRQTALGQRQAYRRRGLRRMRRLRRPVKWQVT